MKDKGGVNPFLMFLGSLILIGILGLSIVSIIGLGFATKFAFHNTSVDDVRSIELAEWELLFIKIMVVMSWISIGSSILMFPTRIKSA